MSVSVVSETAAASVEGVLNHVTPDSLVNRRFVFPGDEVNTGRFAPHRVTIRNARLASERPTLATHGFELFRHASEMTDFTDRAQIDAVYAGEVADAIKRFTGADLVVTIGPVLRNADSSKGEAAQPPAADVHCDTSPTHGPRMAAELFAPHAAAGKSYRRALITSLWRTFSPPPQDWPLALCDGRSIAPGEGVHNYLVWRESRPTPAEMLAPIADEDALPSALIFRYAPHHRWYYYPDMTRDEIVILKLHDTDHSQTWFAPHTAFHDEHRAGARARQSIEYRSCAYWL